MGRPSHFVGVNSVITYSSVHGDELPPLPVFKAEGQIISCWELTEEEKAEVALTGQVWVSLLANEHPPAVVTGHALVTVEPPKPKFILTDRKINSNERLV